MLRPILLLINRLAMPGTILHELGHYLLATAIRARVADVKWFYWKSMVSDDGYIMPDGGRVLGYVIFEHRQPQQVPRPEIVPSRRGSVVDLRRGVVSERLWLARALHQRTRHIGWMAESRACGGAILAAVRILIPHPVIPRGYGECVHARLQDLGTSDIPAGDAGMVLQLGIQQMHALAARHNAMAVHSACRHRHRIRVLHRPRRA